MDVLLVGGTGLISTGVTRGLAAVGHDVTCLTRGETSADLPSGVEFRRGDRNDPAVLDRAAREVSPDCVIDMVCFDPETARDAVAAFGGVADQYVFCSTVDAYHRPLDRMPVTEAEAVRESDREGEPVSAYGANKAAAEDVFLDAHGDAFATTIVRPWSTYGEGGPVLHTLGTGSYYVDRIREGKPVIVHGDGTSVWGPCHRDDVAGAFVGAVGNPDAHGEAYHVTSEECMTWNEYHRTVARALDAPDPDLVHVPTDVLREAFPERTDMLRDHFRFSTVFDNAKAKRDLGFSYEVGFEEGVRRTVADMDARGAVEPWNAENDDAFVAAWREGTAEVVANWLN